MAETENPVTQAVSEGELHPENTELVGSVYIDVIRDVENPEQVNISVRSDGISRDLLTAVLDSATKISRNEELFPN